MSQSRCRVVRNLQQVLQGRSLDAVLADQDNACIGRERALVAELTYGVCRWYAQLKAIIEVRLRKPLHCKDQDVDLLLMLGAYQLIYSRVPPHAILSTAVDTSRLLGKGWAAKLVNAVLRGLQRDLQDRPEVIQQLQQRDLATQYAQPHWLVQAVGKAWPQDQQKILAALQQRAPMTLRLNRKRASVESYLALLNEQNIAAKAHELAPDAILLQEPMPVEQVPGFADGLVSVQDAGAQLAAHLLDMSPGQRILDACAAPGGKTVHILELADSVQVTVVDLDANRLQRLHANLRRTQLHAEVFACDALKPPNAWLQQPFDRILLDAPCSAVGVMRRHPDIRLLRRAGDIKKLANRQFGLLQALWPCLKPSGKLLYATCSFLPAENSELVQHFVSTQSDAQMAAMPATLPSSAWGRLCKVGRQILPAESDMDGFYYALLQKKQS